MALHPLAMLDRAAELSSLQAPERSLVRLPLESQWVDYFRRLQRESHVLAQASRLVAAVRHGRPIAAECALARARAVVLSKVDLQSGATASDLVGAVEAEQIARDRADFGRSITGLERQGLIVLTAPAERKELAELIRRRQLSDHSGQLRSRAPRQRRVLAVGLALMVAAVSLSSAMLVWTGKEIEPAAKAAILVSSIVICWWFSKDLFASARRAEAALRNANDLLGLKLLATENRPEAQSKRMNPRRSNN